MEHRFNAGTNKSQTHGVFLFRYDPLFKEVDLPEQIPGSAAGSDILLLTPPSSSVSLIEYRMIGGTLDFYFFSGPTPQKVIEQYGELIGFSTWQPAFGFGFHLCRWGYANISETREQVAKMRQANIPLEGTHPSQCNRYISESDIHSSYVERY